MQFVKRLVLWSIESLAALLLLGALSGFFLAADFIGVLPGMWVRGIIIGTSLFVNGYYLTTAVFGVVWRSARAWVYPAIAALLFVIHLSIAFARSLTDLTPVGRATLLAGGACIVFACAFLGGWFLRTEATR